MGSSTVLGWARRAGAALLLGGMLVGANPAAPANAFAASGGGDTPGILIVGGGNATQTYSFMVSLQNASGSHFCGGSLISSRWVVTAKHCVAGTSSFRMRIGSNNRTSGGTVVTSLRVIRHPTSDLAVVQTSAAVSQAPVTIAGSTAVGQRTRIIGWGQTCPTPGCGGAPVTLQQLDTALVADSRCAGGGIRGATEICVGNVGGRAGACYGDSGGPALTPGGTGGFVLTGATSRSGGSSTCGIQPAIYVDVPAHRSWIRTNTGV